MSLSVSDPFSDCTIKTRLMQQIMAVISGGVVYGLTALARVSLASVLRLQHISIIQTIIRRSDTRSAPALHETLNLMM